MKLRHLALAAALMIVPAGAQVSQDPSLAPAGQYAVDKAHTRITWSLSHLGFSFYQGWLAKFDATLTFDPTSPEKSTLEASVDTTSVTTLDPEFDKEIAGPEFLNAGATNPITFKTTSVEKTGDATGKMTGDLTLNGVTKPVTFDVTFIGGGQSQMKNTYVLGFQATATIKRSEFGVTKYIDFGLGDDVTITVNTEFDHKP